MAKNPPRKMTTDELMGEIGRLRDGHGVQITLSSVPGTDTPDGRAPGGWLAHARLPDGQMINLQAKDDQRALLARLVAVVQLETEE